MKIKWLRNSCFLITTEKGIRIITDPYQHDYQPNMPPPEGGPEKGMLAPEMNRPPVTELADVVAITHSHADHDYVFMIRGNPRLYRGPAPVEIKGVRFGAVDTYHGDNRGNNTVIYFEADGTRYCHLGDMGHKFSDRQLAQLGRVDILFTPWDNNNITMPFEIVDEVIKQLQPRVIFPMHHVHIDNFIKNKRNVKWPDYSEVEFKPGKLPAKTQIIVLKPAL